MYGPLYAVMTVLLGGGGTAALTDNLPVTAGEFRIWTVAHITAQHPLTETAIDQIQGGLTAIQLEQTRESLKRAYSDKCVANGAALEYIDREIDRLETIYFTLTEREYDPPPCSS